MFSSSSSSGSESQKTNGMINWIVVIISSQYLIGTTRQVHVWVHVVTCAHSHTIKTINMVVINFRFGILITILIKKSLFCPTRRMKNKSICFKTDVSDQSVRRKRSERINIATTEIIHSLFFFRLVGLSDRIGNDSNVAVAIV